MIKLTDEEKDTLSYNDVTEDLEISGATLNYNSVTGDLEIS